jgi:phosphoenolpyruvate carboxylase
VTSGWQTEDLPRTRLTVADEREHVLFYLAEVIYRIVPPLYEEIEIALEQVYGIPVGSVAIPCVLRFGSWVGGDMDGNPDVHAKTIRETLHRQQQVIISTYYDECLGLARKLSQSDSRIDISRRLQARIGEYTTILPRAQPAMAARHDRMPYRTFMGQVAERLRTTYDGRPNHYENVGQFIADIELVAESLRENHGRHAGLFHVERLIRRARTFGFHLATLDVRQHADVHRAVVGQGMGDADWPQRDRAERARILAEAVTSDRGPTGPLGPVGRRTLAVFEAMVQARHRFGARAVGDYVVSGCEGVDDMLSVLLLARWADVTDKKTGQVPIDVVPLFETVVALEGCADTFRALNAEPAYRSHAEARGRRQTVMIGYADTNKESGIAAARFAVHQAQASLVAAARELGTGLCIFHGRSAAIGRGGRTESLVRGAPPGTVHGELRVSEQGEVIHNSYGLRAIAMRTFEQAVHSVMLYTATAASRKPADARFVDAMGCMARASRARYRDLIYGTPGFYGFFREVTPIDVIERMQLGSRPAHRPEQTGLAALRTVPWLFAWTQSRHLLPGWFGVGTGLEAIAREHGPEVIARMHAEWPFFAGLLADVEFQLAKGDRGVFEHYHALAPATLASYADEILAEHALAIRWVTWAKGEVDLMDSDPVLQRTVLLRTPYLDPMHLMQIDLLRRWRASGREDEALFRALIASVSGIAQGLQAAG